MAIQKQAAQSPFNFMAPARQRRPVNKMFSKGGKKSKPSSDFYSPEPVEQAKQKWFTGSSPYDRFAPSGAFDQETRDRIARDSMMRMQQQQGRLQQRQMPLSGAASGYGQSHTPLYGPEHQMLFSEEQGQDLNFQATQQQGNPWFNPHQQATRFAESFTPEGIRQRGEESFAVWSLMSVFLSGADNNTHLRILMNCGADKVAVNIAGLARRGNKSWTLDLDGEWEWIAYTDGAVTGDQIRYALDNSAKPPLYIVGGDTLAGHEGYVPMWNGEGELPPNRELGLCVTDRVFRDGKLARRALSTRLQGGAMGLLSGSIDPDIAKYDFVISAAWWSVTKYGETQIWDGRLMHRFNADRQQEMRTQYRESIEALGLSFDLVLSGDVDESARMAVESWRAYSESFSTHRPATLTSLPIASISDDDEGPETGSWAETLDIAPPKVRHEHVLLPVIGMDEVSTQTYDGAQSDRKQIVLSAAPNTIRRCDNCVLATSGCPGFNPGHLCAYKIPVEIRSKDQLSSVMTAILEMQTQRVFQARFFEEVTGQELGPDVGLEADRLFRLVEKMAAVMDNRESLKMTVEAKATGGMLSRLFGDKAGQAARSLVNPLDPNRVIDTVLNDD